MQSPPKGPTAHSNYIHSPEEGSLDIYKRGVYVSICAIQFIVGGHSDQDVLVDEKGFKGRIGLRVFGSQLCNCDWLLGCAVFCG